MAAPAAGDIIIRGASTWQRLPKGSDGQVLSIVANAPAWAAEGASVAEIRDQVQYLMFRDDAGYTNLNGLVYDGFTDQTGINNVASANYAYSNGYYSPTGGTSNMVLVSANSTAITNPTSARISAFVTPVDAVTLNTDLKAYASSNGVAYDQITLSQVANLTGNVRQLTGQANVTGASNNITWKLTTHNAKNMQVTGVGLAWF
jgi:hypothetical protein